MHEPNLYPYGRYTSTRATLSLLVTATDACNNMVSRYLESPLETTSYVIEPTGAFVAILTSDVRGVGG